MRVFRHLADADPARHHAIRQCCTTLRLLTCCIAKFGWPHSLRLPAEEAEDFAHEARVCAGFLACHCLQHRRAQLRWALRDMDPGRPQRLDLVLGASLAAGDDGARVAHASARGRGQARDEGDDRLVGLVVGLQPLRRILLGTPTDLTDHDDAFRRRIVHEALQAIDEVRAVEGVATDADASRLAKAGLCGLVHRLICESARPAHDADLAGHVNVPRHDAHLAFTRLDDAGAIRAD
eukprot:CAMPEP_0183402810 /NCGR_PEP_ID=MMETSP0370-20130417/14161_1 /TAXON_ID=268820 /ORGANISM="Peridinium aciculiferum, Strain PAER-2" /LENGTH=235 /DNA_ID=CAMNT_0025584463 /DNA_START=20 /DNA_END=724 /DNA_ORIENTATION=+